MNVKIQSMSLKNFKGIKSLSLNFSDNTVIAGTNASGKTTVFDAFLWLLFGKNSQGQTDFNIKTLDGHGVVIPKIEHEVNAVLLVDEKEVTLRRVYKEKWTVKRGEESSELTGHTTDYYYNGVPISQSEYNGKISLIIDEDLFKLVTNPLYFNSLKMQDRRRIIISLAGQVDETELFNSNQDFISLMEMLSGKTMDEFRKWVASQKKTIKDSLVSIPVRIDEVKRNTPENVNEAEIQAQIDLRTEKVASLNNQITGDVKANQERLDKIREKQNALHTRKLHADSIKSGIIQMSGSKDSERKEKLRVNSFELIGLQKERESINFQVESFAKRVKEIESNLVDLRNEWGKENEKTLVFNSSEFSCPTCNRPFEAQDIDKKKAELTQQFNVNKAASLQKISSEGKDLKAVYDRIVKDIEKLKGDEVLVLEKITAKQKENDNLITPIETVDINTLLSENSEYSALMTEITSLEKGLSDPILQTDVDSLKAEISVLQSEVDDLKSKLNVKQQIEASAKRIKELEAEEKQLSFELSHLDKKEFIAANYAKAKVDLIQDRVNNMFGFVRFKLFEFQINGSEIECCDATFDGVPWNDLNTGMKIQCGIDIINTLSAAYGCVAPIWIDNRESVLQIPGTNSQTISLVVDGQYSTLTVK
jgi:DNA repair exonuclease SbcCD ATPase subunit